ncbi:hypothetical protein [Clostridium sp. OS1-26]|uniref:hypothetical protein n=1 Tax=Clostridium sp. OS1-26 TaxID=3070681 RepID=UPI0027E0428C|nr:hypothetical protein [Clostridium sp. OS1-26]WML33222.1 hypothetical protein RCG18_17960 [Clostridium sp. OS1-26]
MKLKKLLSSLMALSIIAASSLAFGATAKAAPTKSLQPTQNSTTTKNNVKSESNIRSIIPVNQKYSVYCELSSKTISNVERYIRKSLQNKETPTADGIRNVLIENGVSRNIANNISYSLSDLSVRTYGGSSYHSIFPETWFSESSVENAYLILTDGNGNFSLAMGQSGFKNYSTYGILSNRDIENLCKTIKNNPMTTSDAFAYAEEVVVKSNITKDRVMARKIGKTIINFVHNPDSAYEELKDLNENLIVLVSDNNEKVLITREAR